MRSPESDAVSWSHSRVAASPLNSFLLNRGVVVFFNRSSSVEVSLSGSVALVVNSTADEKENAPPCFY